MPPTYFVANLPETTELENLYGLFSNFGTINSFKLIHKWLLKRRWIYAFVKMEENDTAPLLQYFNGLDYQGRRLAVSCIKPLKPITLTPEIQSQIDSIANQLSETSPSAVKQIESIVLWCGLDFALALLEETFIIAASGGMLTGDKSRLRTPGGIYFFIAKPRVYWTLIKQIFPPPQLPSKPVPQDPVPLEIRQAYQSLQEQEKELETRLRQPNKGLFSLTKQLAEVKQKLAQLKREYPELA